MTPSSATSRRCLEQWSITGEAVLIGEPSAPVMLAGFYTSRSDFYYSTIGKVSSGETSPGTTAKSTCEPAVLVTSVACLGRCGGVFELCFDVATLDPASGHYIYLILWADENENEVFDPGEEWKYVIPLYDDKVFGEATDCVYYFDDHDDERRGTGHGWNQSTGLDRYIPVDRAEKNGAKLANETAWATRVS
jgi:hypothetical protein